MKNRKRIAVIGAGISGLSAAYYLKDENEVTLYEKSQRLGGHSRTISIRDKNNQITAVDTGFIVLNDRTYPLLNKLFNELKIELHETEMSFAVSANEGQLEWAGTSIDSLFAQRKNFFSPTMLRGLFDVIKFNKYAKRYVLKSPEITLGELITKMRLKSWFRDYYIIPMGGAIWSCSSDSMMAFPAATLVNFFENHGLLSLNNRPQWYTIKNKSQAYVEAMVKHISKKAILIQDADIISIRRNEDTVIIKVAERDEAQFDEVVFACHPSEILKMVVDIDLNERQILSSFKKQSNRAYTHADITQMPKIKKCWSSWNYLYSMQGTTSSVSVTYWMNKLQSLSTDAPLFITLNPIHPIDNEKIYDVFNFDHPVFDSESMHAQSQLQGIQGQRRSWFCGAYLRYGFHEDGIWSTLKVVEKMCSAYSE